MLEAINSARSSIAIASYIFDGDGIGAHMDGLIQARIARLFAPYL